MKKVSIISLFVIVATVFVSLWFFAESAGLVDEHPERLTKAWLIKEDDIRADSDFSEDERKVQIEAEPRFSWMKSRSWNVGDLNINTNNNAKIFLNASKNIDLSNVFQYTYWDVPLSKITDEFPKYAGENIYFSNCTIINVGLIEKTEEISNCYIQDNESYFVEFKDKSDNTGFLYLLSDYGKSLIPLYHDRQEDDVMITGWPLGIDKEGNLVLAY